MSDQEPDEQPELDPPVNEDTATSERERRSRPRALTAEQRRLLGKPRPIRERVEGEKEVMGELAPPAEPVDPTDEQRRETRKSQEPAAKEHLTEESVEPKSVTETPRRVPHAGVRRREDKSTRAMEMQHAALIFGIIAACALTFYAGKKFDYWRYLMSRNKPKLTEKVTEKYRDIPANELVEQALVAERAGRFNDAGERFLAAKHKNLQYRGILFRVGKMAYDHGNFDVADRLLDRAVAFGENIDLANYLRGMIAIRRGDFAAAERFFEGATTTEPFVADYFYYWAEALRLDQHPRDAVMRYEQAARRARDDQDLRVCQFKVRIARLESGENEKLKADIEAKGSEGPLPLDWLMTDAAVAIREGRIEDAVRSVTAARAASVQTENGGGIFLSCKGDALFQDACKKYPALADACEVKTTTSP